MDNNLIVWVSLSFILGTLFSKSLDFVASNVQYKKGFISGYKIGLKEAQLTNLKVTTRFDPLKSMIITNHVHVPDSPDIDFHVMNEHRNKELLEMNRRII